MIRRPPRSTRTDTLFPYTTLFRSAGRELSIRYDDGPKMDYRFKSADTLEWRKDGGSWRSEEHTSELQSLMRISYAVFCLKKKKIHTIKQQYELQNTHKENIPTEENNTTKYVHKRQPTTRTRT